MHSSTKMKCMYIACLCPTLVLAAADTLWIYLFFILFKCKYPYCFFDVHQDLLSFHLALNISAQKGSLVFNFFIQFLLFFPQIVPYFLFSRAFLAVTSSSLHCLKGRSHFLFAEKTHSFTMDVLLLRAGNTIRGH